MSTVLTPTRTEAAPAPACNTGVYLPSPTPTYRIDWISGSFPCREEDRDALIEQLRQTVELVSGEAFDEEVKRGRGGIEYIADSYGNAIKWATEGSIIPLRFVFLELKGKFLETVNKCDIRALINTFVRFHFNCTRIDICCDIYNGQLSINRLLEACQKSQYVGKSRQYRTIETKDFKGNAQGRTVYIGSRQSETFYRFYDKGLETGRASEGEWVRGEGEFKGDCANRAFWLLHTVGVEQFETTLKQILWKGIDFRHTENLSDHHVERCKRLEWWSAIVDAPPFSWIPKKVESSLVKVKAFLEDKMSAIFACVYESMDRIQADGWIERLLKQGEAKFRGRHYALLRTGFARC